jgi:release factor glutamine methyltransferase
MSDHRRLPDTAYTSDLPLEHVERTHRRHEEGLRAARAEAVINGQAFDYLGLTLYVPPQVQPICGMSRLLGEVVPAEV